MTPSAYDEVEYPGYAYPQTHPDRLATIARLFGLQPARVSGCRVLELGCGDGGNLLPMALALPEGEFLGVDAAERPVAQGNGLARAAALENVELRALDLELLPDDSGLFDYVIAHGVYSWVPPRTRAALLAACRRHLAPQGVAYVSYNAYPGSHLRDMARDVFDYHLRDAIDPAQRVARAHELMELIVSANAQTPYARVLREHMERLLSYSDWLLVHDDLAAVNTPFYFHEFMDHAHAQGLQFLSEADIYESRIVEVPDTVTEALSRLPEDVVVREQYLDFLKNRMFRQTLLCHAEAIVDRRLDDGDLDGLAIASAARPASAQPELSPGLAERFETPSGGALESVEPVVKAAMLVLADESPGAVPFDALLARACARLDAAGERGGADRELLRSVLLRAYVANVVELRTEPPPLTVRPGARPIASRLARAQVQGGASIVTTLVHTNIAMEDLLGRQLLLLLDGTRDRRTLISDLAQRLDSDPGLREDLASGDELPGLLDSALERLARLGLLQAEPA